MARRRGDDPPGLIDRVRWGNLGRLAAVLAAGLLIAVGPRACGSEGSKPVAQTPGLLPGPSAAGDKYGAGAQPPPAAERPPTAAAERAGHKRRKRKRRHAHKRSPNTPYVRSTAPTRVRRYTPRYTTRRYYSRPRYRYVAPAPRYSPPPEPPRGTPEFL